jgi:hypothetical protein
MEPVKLATCRIAPATAGGETRAAAFAAGGPPPSGVAWMKFGDELVYYGEAQHWPKLTESVSRAGASLRERPGTVDRARLHVVVQKGGLFQREHPEVPVLLDKGRFLLVDLDPAAARKLSRRKEPCYSVRGLDALDRSGAKGRNRVVFETRSRDAERAAARASDPKVQALVDRLSRATLKADLTRLATFPTRLSTSSHYKAACDFVEQQLASLGYATSRQTITVNGKRSQNVVARRNGSGPASRGMVLVTAHLDSINHEDGAAAAAPGADDDGSGSAGAIEIARALKDHTGRHDLRVVLFGGEEQGLFGSRHFVAAMPAAQRSKVRAVVQMDMIGMLNVPAPSVLLEGRKLSQSVIDGLAAAAATYTGLTVKTSLNAADSDHESFLDKGIPAVLTIEGADHSNHEIHSARDTLDRINFDLALEILRMNTAFVAEALDRK